MCCGSHDLIKSLIASAAGNRCDSMQTDCSNRLKSSVRLFRFVATDRVFRRFVENKHLDLKEIKSEINCLIDSGTVRCFPLGCKYLAIVDFRLVHDAGGLAWVFAGT